MSEKILSIFIDESGDFGEYDFHAPYYMVAMVFHDQGIDISSEIAILDHQISNLGFPPHAIHIGPLIRRESLYAQYDNLEARKSLLNAIYHFARRLDIHYLCPYIKKAECRDFEQMSFRLSQIIFKQLQSHQDYLMSFDSIIVYYDNGQNELTKILTTVFNQLFRQVEFRKVQPADYKLFQVADLICTWELLALKADQKNFSRSELEFFDSPHSFKKNRLKLIQKKRL